MAKQAGARVVDLDPIDRLEDKIKLLVNVVTDLRAEQARAAEENARLARDLDAFRARLAEAQGAGAELDALRHEREAVRQRVAEMLSHLEAI
ncbi:MAG: cell division protein ZapB [Acidobacteria bacterium]|nr:cell division protein ZapB [Acidobacteriota bacterium]